jgi:8-oxo-dGTP diphosphatase
VPDRYTSIIDAHVLLWRDGRLLLLRRAGNVFATGKLCLPSGHMEKDESIVGTIIRETREETGISLDPSGLDMVLTVHRRNPDGHTRFGFFFQPRHWSGIPANREPGKHSELIWADPDRLPADTVDYTAAAIAAIRRGQHFILDGWPSQVRRHQPAGEADTPESDKVVA